MLRNPGVYPRDLQGYTVASMKCTRGLFDLAVNACLFDSGLQDWDEAECCGLLACLACERPWFLSPVLRQKSRERERDLLIELCYIPKVGKEVGYICVKHSSQDLLKTEPVLPFHKHSGHSLTQPTVF